MGELLTLRVDRREAWRPQQPGSAPMVGIIFEVLAFRLICMDEMSETL